MPSWCNPLMGVVGRVAGHPDSTLWTGCGFGNVCARLVAIPEVLSVHESKSVGSRITAKPKP